MNCSLVLPPLTQLNTPYPSTAYLARALRPRVVAQRDLGIELVLRLFSRDGLTRVFDELAKADELPEPAWRALSLRSQHETAIDGVIRFLQGTDRTLATRILDTPFLPRTPRLETPDLDGFGDAAVDDLARRLATLYLEDLADLVTSCIDPGFALARYQHHLASGTADFQPLADRLASTNLVDTILDELTDTLPAGLVGISVPFPGNLYGALRVGRRLRQRGDFVVMGGGYVNTELREVTEPRLWEYVDALCFDDGEGPLLAWLEFLEGGPDRRHRSLTAAGRLDAPHPHVEPSFAADWGELPLNRYLQLVDSLNPTHRLWGDGRWNKITLAHGCYWRRCSFCDITLPYIRDYVPARAVALADAMAEQVARSGQSGFHFVDEAAPPRLVRDLSIELLARGNVVSWWGNIRFEKAWTPDLCRLAAAAGLIAVTGGLEVASDRLLVRMEKGIDIDVAARSCHAFRQAGVLVHAYLMYGFPTETELETVNSLEVVRQFFAAGLLTSAFWHQFVLTRHSGMYDRDADYGFQAVETGARFARNDIPHLDPDGCDPDRFETALPAALAAWKRGQALDAPVTHWLGPDLPSPTENPDRVGRALLAPAPKEGERLLWLGGEVLEEEGVLVLHGVDTTVRVRPPRVLRRWLVDLLLAASPGAAPVLRSEAWANCPVEMNVLAPTWNRVREAGLVAV